MLREEIEEYPYSGVITRVIEGEGMSNDTTIEVYRGVMDEHLRIPEEGHTMQTSEYIISIPLTKNEKGAWCIPNSGDRIELMRYGYTYHYVVNNAEPSQLGGVSIYATQRSW